MNFRVACASDFHFPIADWKSVEWFIDQAKKFEANVIVLNGDLIEAKAASRHAKDERHNWTVKTELEELQKFCKRINAEFPNAHKVWLYGNHEDNLLNYNSGRLPKELHELIREYSDNLIAPEIEYWHVVDHYRHASRWYLGQLCFRHGHDTSKSSIAKDLADYCPYHGLLISGHTHRPIGITQLTINDIRYPFHYANPGCHVIPAKAHYMDRFRLSNWGHGCLLAEVNAPGITEGRKNYDKPNWKAKVQIRKIFSENYFDVAL